MAISMGIVAGVRPAALLLQPGRPARSLCTFKNYLLVSETILISCFIVFGCATILVSQPWYTGGNGQHDNVSTCVCICFSTTCHFMLHVCTSLWSVLARQMHVRLLSIGNLSSDAAESTCLQGLLLKHCICVVQAAAMQTSHEACSRTSSITLCPIQPTFHAVSQLLLLVA